MSETLRPKCPQSGSPVSIFCCNEHCQKPAFSCSLPCLQAHHQHGTESHHLSWINIEPQIKYILKPSPTSEDLEVLKRQNEQIQNLIQKLKQIHEIHVRTVEQERGRLAVKHNISRIIESIKQKSVQQISGSDMSSFMKMIKKSTIFANGTLVQAEINNERKIITNLIQSISKEIEYSKQQLQEVMNIPIDIEKSNLDQKVVIKNGIISVPVESEQHWYPIMLKQPLKDNKYFQVEIVDGAWNYFRVGVGVYGLSKIPQSKLSEVGKNNICIRWNGSIHIDGEQKREKFRIELHQIVTVRRCKDVIKWLRDSEQLCEILIPEKFVKTPLYPLCWICSDKKEQHKISAIRFI